MTSNKHHERQFILFVAQGFPAPIVGYTRRWEQDSQPPAVLLVYEPLFYLASVVKDPRVETRPGEVMVKVEMKPIHLTLRAAKAHFRWASIIDLDDGRKEELMQLHARGWEEHLANSSGIIRPGPSLVTP